jgi:predicted TIM-barrel fold metal-dependent hydrolase
MDREGIDVAVLFPSRGLFALGLDSSETAHGRALSPDLAAAISRAYNNWLYDLCAANRSRLYGAAMVPPHAVDAGVKETRRCVQELGFRSIFLLPGWVNARPWHDPHYDPLWAECQELDVPVVFHGGGPDLLTGDYGQGFRASLMMWHTFAHALGPMSALVSMIGGGVFDRFPRLRAGFLEGNCSWAPWLIYRLEDQYEDYVGRHEIKLRRRVSEYFVQNCFVSVEADEGPVDLYVQRFGDDNVAFSTDYPHPDAKFPHAVDKFLSLPLSDTTRRKFLWDNCARLYGLGAA